MILYIVTIDNFINFKSVFYYFSFIATTTGDVYMFLAMPTECFLFTLIAIRRRIYIYANVMFVHQYVLTRRIVTRSTTSASTICCRENSTQVAFGSH